MAVYGPTQLQRQPVLFGLPVQGVAVNERTFFK